MNRVHHRFTVDEYDRMIDSGILTEDDRAELIRGEIVQKMTIGSQHVACVNRLTRMLVSPLTQRAIVSIQNPIRLSDSEPEPDVSLLRYRDDFYASGKPSAGDVLLVIEVADTTLDDDREVKGPLYAEAGIVEYWIVNLIAGCLEVHRRPGAQGAYEDVRTLRPGDRVEPAAFPGLVLAVSDLF